MLKLLKSLTKRLDKFYFCENHVKKYFHFKSCLCYKNLTTESQKKQGVTICTLCCFFGWKSDKASNRIRPDLWVKLRPSVLYNSKEEKSAKNWRKNGETDIISNRTKGWKSSRVRSLEIIAKLLTSLILQFETCSLSDRYTCKYS